MLPCNGMRVVFLYATPCLLITVGIRTSYPFVFNHESVLDKSPNDGKRSLSTLLSFLPVL